MMRSPLIAVTVVASLSLLLLTTQGLQGAAAPWQSAAPSRAAFVEPNDRGGPPPTLTGDDVWLDEMDLTGDGVVTADTRLEDVRLSAEDVLISAEGLHARVLTVDAVVPFSVVAEEVGPDVRVSAVNSSEARVIRTVQVLGREVLLSATGTVEAEEGQVVVEPASVEVGGPQWLEGALGFAARRLVTIRHTVEGLPPGLRLDEVSVVDTGFRVKLSGRDVRLGG